MVQKLDVSSRLCIDGSATATRTRGFKFRSILPTTHLFVRKYSTFQKPMERIILHCWSCAKEGREFELCNYLETAKRHIFGNHRIEFGSLFSTILPLSRPDRVAKRDR